MTEQLVRRVVLSDGFVLEFLDRSNRYFGDYHRVLIDVEALIGTEKGTLRLRYQHPLKRMGVCGSEVGEAQEALIDQFLETAGSYMQQSGFVAKLLAAIARPGMKIWKQIA